MDLNHWSRAIRGLATQVAADARQRDFPFTKEWLSFALTYDQRGRAPAEHVFSLYPAVEDLAVDLGVVRYQRSNVNPFELFCLKAVAALTAPNRIFEIGTFDGATSLELARSAPQAQVFTLDLPSSEPTPAGTVPEEMDHVRAGGVGRRFAGTIEAHRITQLLGDSRYFDYSPYEGTIDLVFVDAAHEYSFVRADTVAALRLVAPGGTVFWHDYQPGWPGVIQAVDELTAGLDIHHLTGTDLAVLRQSGPRARE